MRIAGIIAALSMLVAASCSQRTGNMRQADNMRTIAITDSVLANGASDTLRLGNIYSGEVAVQKFAFINKSSAPIVLIRHETTCNCTTFDYGHRPILPDSQAVVTCRFDSSGQYGWQFKLVKFRLSGAETAFRLFIEANVE